MYKYLHYTCIHTQQAEGGAAAAAEGRGTGDMTHSSLSAPSAGEGAQEKVYKNMYICKYVSIHIRLGICMYAYTSEYMYVICIYIHI